MEWWVILRSTQVLFHCSLRFCFHGNSTGMIIFISPFPFHFLSFLLPVSWRPLTLSPHLSPDRCWTYRNPSTLPDSYNCKVIAPGTFSRPFPITSIGPPSSSLAPSDFPAKRIILSISLDVNQPRLPTHPYRYLTLCPKEARGVASILPRQISDVNGWSPRSRITIPN
ncbi:hypothetical protein L873DRAFT_608991 [Choiromyces venosus 120613-1]|uniref:Uncharacterized protein n=1 Tax=Choiromyces venosus 120613-1 TaxID=1336337 RepID=A0A3N4JU37_9PEZI|nr:hypothetical protein L873DRAFT_608991 [Choiromyces venosus 120613-1]